MTASGLTTEGLLHSMQRAVLEAIATGEPLETALNRLCIHAEQLAPGIACSVLRVDEQGKVRPIAGPSLPEAYSRALDGVPIGPEVGSCGTAAYFGEAVEIHDIDTDPRWQPFKAMPLAAGLLACWSTPIKSRSGQVIGTFAFYFRSRRGPDELERRIVEAGVHLCMIAIERDDAQRRAATTALQFSAALESMSQGLCLFGPDERLIVHNQRFAEIYGLAPERIRPGLTYLELTRLVWRDHEQPEQAARRVYDERRALLDRGVPSRMMQALPGGTTVAVALSPTGDGGWVATYEDVTDQRRAHERIEYLAHHDVLTGLPNRTMFLAELEKALEGRGQGQAFAVLYLDLDRFKAVNDTLGHGAGDALLRNVADRLRDCVRAGDLVARLSGDEFTVLMRNSPDLRAVELLAQRIVDVIGMPFRLGGQAVSIGACVGICLPTDEWPSADELMHRADLALYRAKDEGRGHFRFFDPSMEQPRVKGQQLGAALRKAVVRQEFELFYQPIVELPSCGVIGFEALIRWQCPARGLVMPNDFIPLAEQSGLILPIGEWVLHRACTDAAAWPEPWRVAVNMSARQFTGGDVVDSVRKALGTSGLPPDRLELEITETMLLDPDTAVLEKLARLRELGVAICLDDFGTGYSSLSYLKHFEFDKLKIDRSFVQAESGDTKSAAVLHAIVALGHGLGTPTTAEGVETRAHLAKVQAEGCAEAQGYLFGRPCRAADLMASLSAGQQAPRVA